MTEPRVSHFEPDVDLTPEERERLGARPEQGRPRDPQPLPPDQHLNTRPVDHISER